VEILNLGGAADNYSPASKSRKKLRVILGIGALAAVTGIGSTLAANISLNGGGNVEFGQGVATTAACDDDITLTPVSTFSNASYAYDDATFAMTAIQISGIDLTPEGWDRSGAGIYGAWHTGFNYSEGTWNAGYEQYSGQYYDGAAWVNTCANKSLILRAYTDNANYAERTAENNIASPLLLNGNQFQRPSSAVGGYNPGVGFRIDTYEDGPTDADYAIYELAEDDTDMGGVSLFAAGDFYWENSSVTVYINYDSEYPSADSRWVDKLTIESAATTPSNWTSEEEEQG
jgi:hypothetical protein